MAPSQLVAGNEETILVINDQSRVLRGEVTLEDNPNLSDDDQYSPQTVALQAGQVRLSKSMGHFSGKKTFSMMSIAGSDNN